MPSYLKNADYNSERAYHCFIVYNKKLQSENHLTLPKKKVFAIFHFQTLFFGWLHLSSVRYSPFLDGFCLLDKPCIISTMSASDLIQS